MKQGIFSLLLLMIAAGCSSPTNQIKQIYDLAGDNRVELEKVLIHYQDQPQKLEAAQFLIGNMAHGFEYGMIMDAYRAAILDCDSPLLAKPAEVVLADTIWIEVRNGGTIPTSTQLVYDAKVITADYLINNIDRAFEAWEKSPWHSKVDFSAFCHYILPYRITKEPLTDWRKTLRDRYLPLIEGIEDPGKAFTVIYNRIYKDFQKWNDFRYPYTMDPLMLNKVMRGRCEDRTLYMTSALRALGIPVAYDYILFWGNGSAVNHSWVSYIQHDSTFTLFSDMNKSDINQLEHHGALDASQFYQMVYNYRVSDLPFDVDSLKRVANIFRYCFDIQDNRMKFLKIHHDAPDVFRNLFQQDVSEQYGLSGTYRFSTNYKEPVYLCAFRNGRDWTPIVVSEPKHNKVIFECLEKKMVYLPCGYRNGELFALALPFYLTEENDVQEFIPDTTRRRTVSLNRKTSITVHWTDRWAPFLGGRFEGSNTADFSKTEILHEITVMPSTIERIKFSQPKRYRYIRFIAPENEIPNFAEIAFLGKSPGDSQNEIALTGKVIWDRVSDIDISMARATDKDYSTFFHEEYQRGVSDKHYWFGYDLGVDNEYLFTGVEFCPHNDQNMVEPGDLYELFYFNGEWISLGQQEASGSHLVYDNVPMGALLWLRDLTKGKEERIFTYENGKQVWW